jgi:DNA-binding beta-propeller fold protein YncE
VINADFIKELHHPLGLAVSGKTLFVANGGSATAGTIGKYDATTGAVIKADFIKGLQYAYGIAVLPATDSMPQSFLFVANRGSGTIGKYDARTGAVINASFITGLNGPTAIAVR